MWNQLPELILSLIFDYLNCQDRASVDQTCQAWSHALASPSLWKSIRIIIDRDLRIYYPSTRNLLAKYVQHMRHLELAWSLPYTLPREARVSLNIRANDSIDFLEVIKNKNVQLEKLILTDWYFGTNWNHRSKLVNALARFLRTQRKLKLLSLLNANLGVADVLKVCRAISWSCGNVLEYLDIRGAFRDWQAPHSNSRYIRYLSRLHVLTTFQLDYPALSDEVLNSLASAASNVLKNLHISIRDSHSRQHTVGDAAWNNLVVACPQLTVSYTIVNISHYEDISYLLLPSIPLACFYMYGGHVWDQNRSRNFRSTVGLLITYYPNTLVEVMLQIRNNRELLDDLLVFMIQRCKRLTKLQYDGIIRSLETLRYIFQLQAERKTKFKTIHIKPKNINTQNRAILDDINYQYHYKMLDQGIDFRIEDPTSAYNFF
ncbi:F-box only protein 39-like [Chelonus insularis]|uniref:F-box only protein 39-like n=1 Tax=Chelonus insularis TaxID=460826 RepID=UPI001588708A|nr:F-box only protein 39-like [Chelonus insularis]